MMFSSPESMGRGLQHLIKRKIPEVDAVRNALEQADPKELGEMISWSAGFIRTRYSGVARLTNMWSRR